MQQDKQLEENLKNFYDIINLKNEYENIVSSREQFQGQVKNIRDEKKQLEDEIQLLETGVKSKQDLLYQLIQTEINLNEFSENIRTSQNDWAKILSDIGNISNIIAGVEADPLQSKIIILEGNFKKKIISMQNTSQETVKACQDLYSDLEATSNALKNEL